MDQEIKDEWISRLESGQYPQIMNAMRTHRGYCSIGVLADILAERGYGTWSEPIPRRREATLTLLTGEPTFSFAGRVKDEAEYTGDLPPAIGNEIGLKYGDRMRVAEWNDNEALSFPEIAIRIKEEL